MKKIIAIAAFAFAFSMNGFAQEAPAAPADQSAPKCIAKCTKAAKCAKAAKCNKAGECPKDCKCEKCECKKGDCAKGEKKAA